VGTIVRNFKSASLIGFYIIIVLTPASMALLPGNPSPTGAVYRIGQSCALIGFMILALQPVLAGRLKWIENPLGLDAVMLYHKYADVFALFLLLLHPLLLAAGGAGIQLITSPDASWMIWAGKSALVIFMTGVLTSLFRLRMRFPFEKWRFVHDILAPALLVLAFVHSWFAGSDIRIPPLRRLWTGILGLSFAMYFYHRLIRPRLLNRRRYRVAEVVQETKRVWTVKLVPPEGTRRFDFLPGQFQFITFHRAQSALVEEHHWTISSSAFEKDTVCSTIKESGDFTSTIGLTRPGDTAAVHGPFGRFSFLRHPDENDFVFIAGGIGITPFMSMLRTLRDTRSAFPVLLLYANTGEDEIVFRRELAEIEAGGFPKLNVVHVLSRPSKEWRGGTGHIDREKIEQFCGDRLQERAFYVCGPKSLMRAAIRILRDLGVSKNRIHFEIFSFPN
jgi:predicted ferric reductase